MFCSKEVKTEPEEAEVRLPADRPPHSSCSDPCSAPGGSLDPTEQKLDPDCVKTECDLSPGRSSDQTSHLRRTDQGGRPEYVTLRSQQNRVIKNEAKESSITELKNENSDSCFDDFLEKFIKQRTKENLNQTEGGVLRLTECEVSGSRACRTLMFKRISNGSTKCSTDVTRTISKPNASHETDESQSYTDSQSRKGVDKMDDGLRKKKHFCQLCGRGYIHKRHLGVHMKTHTGERDHRCPECGAAFYHSDGLQAHMSVHSGERPFACDQCGESFRRPGNLREHQRYIHASHRSAERGSGGADVFDHTRPGERPRERPYPCTECGKRFIRANGLKMHQATHTGEKPFTCTECGNRFQRASTLKKHMRIHTGERPYLCSECGKTFPYAFCYSSHMKIHERT